MTVSGVVLSVDVERYGDTLTADTLATDVVLQVGDVIDFADEDDFAAGPQWLTVGDSGPLQYVSVDDDADTVTLAAPVGAAYEAGEPVRMWDAAAAAEVVSHTAWVELDEADSDDQPIPAEVPHDRMIYFGVDNMAGLIDARVILEEDADDPDAWHVAEVTGRAPVTDPATMAAPYLTAYLRSDVPIPHSTLVPVSWAGTVRFARRISDAGDTYLTVPKTGMYVVTATAAFAVNTTGNRYVQITVADADGTGELVERMTTAAPSPIGSTVVQATKTMPLEEGQRVTVKVMQNSGASLDLLGRLDLTAVEMAWVAPR